MFCCKQKTAYEMRISDWSSDVCSSDLPWRLGLQPAIEGLCIDKPERVCGLAAIGLEKGREIGHRPTMPPWINRVESRSARHRNAIQVVLRSEEHTSELQSLMRISYAVFCLKKKNNSKKTITAYHNKYK